MKNVTAILLALTCILALLAGILSDAAGPGVSNGLCAAIGCLSFLFGVLTLMSATDAWEGK